MTDETTSQNPEPENTSAQENKTEAEVTPEKKALPTRHDIIQFMGDGREYFSILILNGILTLITLGIYYPWAKVARLKYLYSHTTLAGDPVTFTATGKEYFYGFIKALLLIGVWYGSYFYMTFAFSTLQIEANLFMIFFLLWLSAGMVMYPFIIHGSYRYRMSRTRWRGIRFAYTGSRSELVKKALAWALYTLLTFGIYNSWYVINLRTYIINHIQLGNAQFKYVGKGGEYFGLNFVGVILTYLTAGIYGFWFYRNLIRFYVDNMRLELDGETFQFQFQGTAGDIFKLAGGNILIIIFTLGLGYPWTVVRTMRTIFDNISLYGEIDIDKIVQRHGDAGDGTADDILDFFEMDMVI